MKKEYFVKVEYENDANDYFHEWWYLNDGSDDQSQEWLKEWSDKEIKVTIEEIKQII